ncbi:hypothetical protein F4810DRAFT_276323 [Camillea tinctor]|nr:hypothetical protein F4810DRAFT_276323 [Camillea tinctor]
MSFLSGTATITHSTPIPLPARHSATAVAVLHDHLFFLRCDPHYTSHAVLPSPGEAGGEDVQIPEDVQRALLASRKEGGQGEGGKGKVKVYEVTDHVPNPVWSSTVVSREEFADLQTGLWVRLKSVLGVVMETTWVIEEGGGGEEEGKGGDGEGKGELRLKEVVNVSCSRVLLPIVKSQVEGGWKGIHEKMVRRMVEDAEKGEGK